MELCWTVAVQEAAYQIGAWKALKEAGIRIHAVAGTSVGAIEWCFDLYG